MGFNVSYLRELYEKAYDEGLRASNRGDYPTAKKKLSEAASYLVRLSQLDRNNSASYANRAERIKRIIQNMPDAPVRAQAQQTASSGSSYSAGGAYSDSTRFQESPTSDDMNSFYKFYEPNDIEGGFEEVVGLQEAKEAVTEYVINPKKYPEAYNYKFMDSQYILLEGPPGTGKTTFAKAVAKEIEQPFALINVAALVSCYVGETGKTIDKVFAALREYADKHNSGLTVFFDEFDEIAGSRTGDDKASQTAVPALLRNLDGMTKNKNFLILANTNCREKLDAGILSRFRRKIFIPLPDENARKVFFEKKLRASDIEDEYFEKLDFDRLAQASEGRSGRDITYSCDEFMHFLGSLKAGLRTCDDLTQAMINIIENKN